MSSQSKKRKKSYYIKAAKGKKARHGHVLEAGLRGFFITCNNREREAVREAYNILNEYADELIGAEQIVTKDEAKSKASSDISDNNEEEEEDIAAALQKEVSSIKNKTHSERRFQVVDSGATNCVFIRTTVERPDELLHTLVSDLHKSHKCKSRFIMRILPVVGTCRADQEKVKNLASEVLPTYFGTGEKYTYCVLTKIRNNSGMSKHQIVPVLRHVIQELNPGHSFDPDDPDIVISMDVVKNVCCMSVMKDFFKFRKYNLQEVVKDPPRNDDTVTEKAAVEDGNNMDEEKSLKVAQETEGESESGSCREQTKHERESQNSESVDLHDDKTSNEDAKIDCSSVDKLPDSDILPSNDP